MKRQKYLNNKDMLKEIHKSKLTYCWTMDEKYEQYDIILEDVKKINRNTLKQAKENKASRLQSEAYAEAMLHHDKKDFEDVKIINFEGSTTSSNIEFKGQKTFIYFWSQTQMNHYRRTIRRVEELKTLYPDYRFVGICIQPYTDMVSQAQNILNLDLTNQYSFENFEKSSKSWVLTFLNKTIIIDEKSNIIDAKIIVVSTAISEKNEEFIAAKKMFLPIVHRSEMLGELMRLKQSIAIAGTHGKTTTTSLIAKMIEDNGMDPTIINGGIISSLHSNARLGNGEWMVVEADESDGSFSKLMPTVAVITNIDLEHLDFHKNEKNLENAFINFISSIPFYGFCSVCIDHPRVQKIFSNLKNRKIITYGLSPNADVKAENIIVKNQKMYFDVTYKNKTNKDK